MFDKVIRFLGVQVRFAILWVIWLIGFTLSLVPFMFFINVQKDELNEKSFVEGALVILIITGTTVVGGLIFLLYMWLKKRWGH